MQKCQIRVVPAAHIYKFLHSAFIKPVDCIEMMAVPTGFGLHILKDLWSLPRCFCQARRVHMSRNVCC